MLFQVVVLFPLRAFKLAVDGLFRLRRQLARNLLFGPPQDERAQSVPSNCRASGLGFRPNPPAIFNTLASPSIPGLRNSNRLHNSPRWFSTGVPLITIRCRPCSSRTAFAEAVDAFLMACASSNTT